MSGETIHLAHAGERLDSLAFRYYGNALQYGPILAANPALYGRLWLQAGERVRIPGAARSAKVTWPANLPPWFHD